MRNCRLKFRDFSASFSGKSNKLSPNWVNLLICRELKNLVSGAAVGVPYFSSPVQIKAEPCDIPQNIFHGNHILAFLAQSRCLCSAFL